VKQIVPAPIAATQVSSSVPTTSSPGAMPPPAQNAANVAQSQAYILPGQRSISHPVTNVVPNVKHPQPDIASPAEETEPQDPDEKKKQKRAANRRSAQLSRKRKKQFIEELKEENDELRRKELILKSIPDLIVVFDSSGKIWFVSDSVNGFLDMTSEELEGTSFWDRLCPESVRLLKAAFMDALAARKSNMATTPLGSGVWELRLVDTEGKQSVITLNGVVHFSSERDSPECVCSIRPRDASSSVGAKRQRGIPVIAHQSVISKQGYVAAADETSHAAPRKAAQISDGDSGGSVISEGGSEP